jgi:hypothetical protein
VPPLAVGGWEKVAAIAAVIAAGAGVVGIVVTWLLGRATRRDSRKALEYERLAEARRLVGEIRGMADNGIWFRVEEAQAQLRPLLRLIDHDLPECVALAEATWSVDTYSGGGQITGLQQRVQSAREELERASASV